MSVHTCHATGCTTPVAPKFLMCPRHWRMAPPFNQVRVWANYVPGQEARKDPTPEYTEAAKAAIDTVAAKEAK